MATGNQLNTLFEALKNKNIIKTKQDFCNLMNIDYKSFSRLLRDELNYPINQTNYDILKKLRINLDWFIAGQGEMFLDTPASDIHQEKTEQTTDDVVYLKLLSNKAARLTSTEVIGSFPLLKELIAPMSAEHLFVIKVSGDAMAPTLFNGDYVISTTELQQLAGEGIYILRMGELLHVKRVQFNFDHTYTVLSDNPRYERQTIPMNTENVEIVAKVIGWVHHHV